MSVSGTQTAQGGPYYILHGYSLLLKHHVVNHEDTLSIYSLSECNLVYDDPRATVKVTWRGSTLSDIEFLDHQEYPGFKANLIAAKNFAAPPFTPSSPPTTPQGGNRNLPSPNRNESVDATPSGTATPVAPTPASPSNNRETREQIAALQLQVAELSSMLDMHAAQTAQATADSESLAFALQDLLSQAPPAPLPVPNPISQERLNSLSLVNTVLQEQQNVLKEQRAKFIAEAASFEQKLEIARTQFETFITEVSANTATSQPAINLFSHILAEARKRWQAESDMAKMDLAKSYYTVFYDLACTENAACGHSRVSDSDLTKRDRVWKNCNGNRTKNGSICFIRSRM